MDVHETGGEGDGDEDDGWGWRLGRVGRVERNARHPMSCLSLQSPLSPQLPVDVVDQDQDARADGAGTVGHQEQVWAAGEEGGPRSRDDGRDRGPGCAALLLAALAFVRRHVQSRALGPAKDGLQAAAGVWKGRERKSEGDANWLEREPSLAVSLPRRRERRAPGPPWRGGRTRHRPGLAHLNSTVTGTIGRREGSGGKGGEEKSET